MGLENTMTLEIIDDDDQDNTVDDATAGSSLNESITTPLTMKREQETEMIIIAQDWTEGPLSRVAENYPTNPRTITNSTEVTANPLTTATMIIDLTTRPVEPDTIKRRAKTQDPSRNNYKRLSLGCKCNEGSEGSTCRSSAEWKLSIIQTMYIRSSQGRQHCLFAGAQGSPQTI